LSKREELGDSDKTTARIQGFEKESEIKAGKTAKSRGAVKRAIDG